MSHFQLYRLIVEVYNMPKKVYVIAEILRGFSKKAFISYAGHIILNAFRHQIVLCNQLCELDSDNIKYFEDYIKNQLEQHAQVILDIKRDTIRAQLIIILSEEGLFIAFAIDESASGPTDLRIIILLLLDLCSDYTVYKMFSATESVELRSIIKKIYQDLYSLYI